MVRSSTLGSTYFSFSIPLSLLMGSLPLQTIVNTWQCFHLFLKACTKGYVVNSCLAPPLNPAVSHSATCSTNLLCAWGAVTLVLFIFYYAGLKLYLGV